MIWPNVALQKGETLKRKRTQIFSAGTQKAARTAVQIGLGRVFRAPPRLSGTSAPFGHQRAFRAPVRRYASKESMRQMSSWRECTPHFLYTWFTCVFAVPSEMQSCWVM